MVMHFLVHLTGFSYILLCLTMAKVSADTKQLPKIAVVGGGIGGASTAYYLKQHFGEGVRVDLYESQKEIGGRVATVRIGDKEYETGGSIIHPANMYMVNLTKELGLGKHEALDGRLGLYDGEEMVFSGSSWSLVALGQMFWRYGWDMYSLNNYINDMLNKFSRIYKHQEKGFAFTTPTRLIESMSPDFVANLQYSLKETLLNKGFSEMFLDELANGALRTNYGQNNGVHAFVGSVSIAGAMPGLWRVVGGNKLVPQNLVKKSAAKVVHEKVIKIVAQQEDKYTIVTDSNNENTYDFVIVATPLHDRMSGIEFVGLKNPISDFPPKFHRTVATFVRGQPNFVKFGYKTFHEFPEAVLTTKDLFFNSIGKQSPTVPTPPTYKDKQLLPIWKVFSQAPLTDQELDELFLSYEDKHEIDWLAYPHYSSIEVDVPPFELAPHLYYVNAFEVCTSTLETSVISGRNVALLAYNVWNGRSDKINPSVYDDKGAHKEEL